MTAAPKFPVLETHEYHEESFAELSADQAGFQKLAAYLKERAGINLPVSGKNLSLMAGRVGGLLRRQGFSKYQQLYHELTHGNTSLEKEFIRVMTTNTTHWFREDEHFNQLHKMLLQAIPLAQKEGRELKIWCAAASSGPEPYTIAIVVCEAWAALHGKGHPPVKILGTDINEKVLTKAAAGTYSEAELQGLPENLRGKYLSQHQTGQGLLYQVNSSLSAMTQFAPLNLLSEKFPFRGHFDFIFCRNVFIYFEREVCVQILNKMAQYQKPGAILFLGHAEAGAMRSPAYHILSHALFERTKL